MMQKFNEWRKTAGLKTYWIIAAGIIAGLLLLGTAVWKKQQTARQPEEEIPQVRTMVITPANTGLSHTYSGEVRGRYESQLAFQVSGKIIDRRVNLGSTVRAGDVLMQLDPKDLQQTSTAAAAQLASAQSQLQLAQSNLNRYRTLYEQNAISLAQLDQYQNAYEVAVAAVRQASAQYAQSANQLNYSALSADQDGVVAAVAAETGQVVAAGQTVITLVRDGEREVEINVPENQLAVLRQAQQIQATFWALPEITLTGRLRETAPVANAVSRTYKARISLPDAPPEIQLGMTASVIVKSYAAQSASGTFLPLSAVYQTNDTPAVWVVVDNTVHLRPVQPGIFGKADLQILGGLNPGEIIVTAGVHKLREGQKVRLIDGDV